MSPADQARRVSVVIPTHNRGDLVAEAIRSVLGQTVPPRELIVVDDKSEDDTPEILSGFGESIRVVRTEANVERGHARNLGARNATGDVLAFLDSDDAWEPDKLARQLSEGPGPDVPSVTGLRYIDGDRVENGTYLPPAHTDQRLTIDNYCLGAPSSLVLPVAAFGDVGGFPEERQYQGSEDWMFLVKLLWAGWPIEVIRKPLVRYRIHPGGWTHRPENLERSMWSACAWLDQQRIGPPHLISVRRSRVAAAIATAHLADGNWRRGGSWGRIALSEGSPTSRIHGAWRMLRTTARRLLTARRQPSPP
jgi:hypothetical protein